MTAKSRVNLKAAFETGDVPDGDDFSDLIDSALNITDASAQALASPISVPSISTGTVSATTVNTNVQYVRGLSTHENPYIEAYTETTAISSVAATAAWAVVCAALTAPLKSSFSVSGHDITYTGGVTAKFSIVAALEVVSSANTNTWFAIMKNNALVSSSRIQTRLPVVVLQHYDVQAIVELKGNDIINVQTQMPDGPIHHPEVFGVNYQIFPIFWG